MFMSQVVLITGASSGLGEALAHSFYRAGCQVVLAARREIELQRVREDLIRCHEVNFEYAQKLNGNLIHQRSTEYKMWSYFYFRIYT
jgi:NADP-dependent 3-hydroxy acid dehydrogenase YdfG